MAHRYETGDHYVNSGETRSDRDEYLLALAHLATSHAEEDASGNAQYPETD